MDRLDISFNDKKAVEGNNLVNTCWRRDANCEIKRDAENGNAIVWCKSARDMIDWLIECDAVDPMQDVYVIKDTLPTTDPYPFMGDRKRVR